jgi:MoxR-like ATPase
MFNQKTGEFEFRPGAIMSQIVLADEINRTSPKTQASLLEVMEENQITVDGVTYKVPSPFMVMATQNPIEYLGTFPLPEAQLDRFFMKISIGYPLPGEESYILSRFQLENPLNKLEAVVESMDIIALQEEIKSIYVDRCLNNYIVDLVNQTRNHPDIALGSSPRGSLALYRASQAWAFYQGRNFCLPDDVKRMVIPVLSHRIMFKQEAKIKKLSINDIMHSIINMVNVPVVDVYEKK